MSDACFHCQEPIPKGFKANLTINGAEQAFCCYGCLAIAETIQTGGLSRFYQHRTQASVKPEEFSSQTEDELRLFDDKELQHEFLEQDGEFNTVSLNIGGITCSACIWLLEKEVNKHFQLDFFTVNHSNHKARLRWKDGSLNLSDVLILIRRLGFKAFPYEEGKAREFAQQEKKTTLFRIAIAGISSMQSMMFALPLYLGLYSGMTIDFVVFFRWVSLLMCIPVVLYSSVPFYRAALRDIRTGHLTMDIPVSIAIIGAFTASAWITVVGEPSMENDVYFDSVAMFTFFLLLGRFIEMQSRHKHLNSDIEIASLLPSTALIKSDGKEVSIPAHKLRVDDIIVVKQGQIIAADGIVIEGYSRVDESALSGEFLPIEKTPGSFVSGGTTNAENTLAIKISATPKNSRVSAIIKMIDNASRAKPRTVVIADKVASYFVAAVLLVSLLVGCAWYFVDPSKAFPIVLSILVVTCPCALALATPTALTSTNLYLREKGFLITQAHALEAMTQITDLVFDKTGTLTKGKLSLESVICKSSLNKEQCLEIAAALESHSAHPIANAFKPFYKTEASQIKHHIGRGIEGKYSLLDYQETTYYLGNFHFISEHINIQENNSDHGLVLYLASETELIAQFVLSDSLREDSYEAIKAFQKLGIKTHILSGDQQKTVASIAEALNITSYKAQQSPEEKLTFVKNLQTQGKEIAMVGDGINDLPVLSGTKLSVAMGEASDITKMNSDAVLLNSKLRVLSDAFSKAAHTKKIIKENIAWAIAYNICALPLAAMGMIPPVISALGMSLSSLIVIFNSLRLRR